MVHLEEITDEVAEKLQVSENNNSSSTPPPSQPKSANILPSKNVVDSLPENPILTKLRAAAEAGPSAAGPALVGRSHLGYPRVGRRAAGVDLACVSGAAPGKRSVG